MLGRQRVRRGFGGVWVRRGWHDLLRLTDATILLVAVPARIVAVAVGDRPDMPCPSSSSASRASCAKPLTASALSATRSRIPCPPESPAIRFSRSSRPLSWLRFASLRDASIPTLTPRPTPRPRPRPRLRARRRVLVRSVCNASSFWHTSHWCRPLLSLSLSPVRPNVVTISHDKLSATLSIAVSRS